MHRAFTPEIAGSNPVHVVSIPRLLCWHWWLGFEPSCRRFDSYVGSVSNTFTAATWNVFHRTPIYKLRPIARELKEDGVDLILAQEADADVANMFKELGYRVAYLHPQFIIARSRDVFSALNEGHGITLSPTGFVGNHGGIRHSEALVQRLQHKESGKKLKVMTYHTPAHVQVSRPEYRRVKAAVESAQKWGRIADKFEDGAKVDALLFGGDDNVDETGNFMDRLRWFRDRYTGLHQIEAPTPTFGKRRIDDFRIKGDIRARGGYTVAGAYPDEHRVHVRNFELV